MYTVCITVLWCITLKCFYIYSMRVCVCAIPTPPPTLQSAPSSSPIQVLHHLLVIASSCRATESERKSGCDSFVSVPLVFFLSVSVPWLHPPTYLHFSGRCLVSLYNLAVSQWTKMLTKHSGHENLPNPVNISLGVPSHNGILQCTQTPPTTLYNTGCVKDGFFSREML